MTLLERKFRGGGKNHPWGGRRYGYFLESHIKVIKVNFVKNDVCQKFIKGLAKYSNEMTKSGMLTVSDF